MSSSISIKNACTHNLQGVNLSIPHEKLTVITGVSGSGKSSLAIDTLFAEGQRQYIESLSTYARQFLNQLERPPVDSVEGLEPTLCIDQKSGTSNPRSTVATVTEIYDYLRLLWARAGTAHCYACGSPIQQQTPQEILREIQRLPANTKLVFLSPVVRGRKGAHRDELNAIRKAGLVRVRVDGQILDLDEVPDLAVRKNHSIDAVVDRIILRDESSERIAKALQLAMELSSGLVSVSYQTRPEGDAANENTGWQERLFSQNYACPNCGISYAELEPRTFSFNSPYGACSTCNGLGQVTQFSPERILPSDSEVDSVADEAWVGNLTAGLARKTSELIHAVETDVGLTDRPADRQLTSRQKKSLLFGNSKSAGLVHELEQLYATSGERQQAALDELRQPLNCRDCNGTRLRPEARSVTIDHMDVQTLIDSSIEQFLTKVRAWNHQPEVVFGERAPVARPILRDLLHRLEFLTKVGVGYLALSRPAQSLSGGELQRVRLATSIGSGLVGVCYILDEPSIGLHQRDNDRLIESLRDLQTQGNTVVVVEHDESMMLAADNLVDIGPDAGTRGGRLIAEGPPDKFLKNDASLTARYLRHEESMARTSELRQPTKQDWLHLKGASLHNLQKVNLELPLRMLVGISGVSGSGKSSLISGTLVPALCNKLRQADRSPGPYLSLRGYEALDKLIEVTQTPIGRNSRSTPSTYCGVWDLIRKVWANTRESKQRGFSSSRFSFNAGSGRCESCAGLGQQKIEMNFLPDLFVDCSACGGKRFNRQTLQVRYRDKTIADILEMPVDEALDFFANFDRISALLSSLVDVGLGYLTLGQSSSSLSGGEAQRIKLATELAKRDTGKTIYFLDEPTTGLHFADVKRLIAVLDELVSKGNTVVVIEHNLDIIRACDWVVDMGPEGGDAGGQIVACGSPEVISKTPNSHTGRFLAG